MIHRTYFVAEIQRQIVLKFQIFHMNSFEDIIVGSWSILTENTQVTSYFHYIFKTRFFLEKVHLIIFVAEIQTRIVLKFEIFLLSSFWDMGLQSRSGRTLLKSQNEGHNEHSAFRPQNLAEF